MRMVQVASEQKRVQYFLKIFLNAHAIQTEAGKWKLSEHFNLVIFVYFFVTEVNSIAMKTPNWFNIVKCDLVWTAR